MNNLIKDSSRTGLIFSIVMTFLLMIGFVFTFSQIIGGWIKQEEMFGLVAFIGVYGLLLGRSVYQKLEEKNWKNIVVSGLVAGLVAGLILAIFVLLVGTLQENKVNMRQYLPNLSPQFIDFILYENESIVVGALINFGVVLVSSVLGSILSWRWELLHLIKRLNVAIKQSTLYQKLQDARDSIQSHPVYKYGLMALGLAAIVIIPQFLNESWNLNLGTIGIYVLMGIGLNLVVGTAGLLDLGFVAFYAIGAYSVGLLTAPKPLGIMMDFWPAFLLGIVFAVIAGFLIGIPVVRLRGDYLAIVTLGFGEIIAKLINSDTLEAWTGGPQGVKDIAQPSILGMAIDSKREYLYIILFFVILGFFITNRLQYSRIGRTWLAMREDETVAEAMGINTFKYKLLAFMIGASFAGVAGGLFAARNYFTGPADHTLMVSVNVLSEIIVGGLNSIGGIITGSIVLKGLPEILRQVENYRMVTFGALLVIMMIWRPEGLWPAKRKNIFKDREYEESAKEENND